MPAGNDRGQAILKRLHTEGELVPVRLPGDSVLFCLELLIISPLPPEFRDYRCTLIYLLLT